jgi:uncharacterized protein (TIGR00106 family)
MVLAEFSVYPLGRQESVGDYIARCLKIIEASGMDYQCHAMGTTIEGDLDEVIDVVKQCVDDLSGECNRVECTMKLDYRKGYKGELKSRVGRIETRLGHPVKQ